MVSTAHHRSDLHRTPALRYLRLLGRAASYVDAHLDSPLDAATLAAEAAMSRHHFHRLFHAHLGLTVGSYITWRRLQRACAQLKETTAPVLDIALSAGFSSAQALAKAMQRELGLTPTAVRSGQTVRWPEWLARQRILEMPLSPRDGRSMLKPRWSNLPDLVTLTASGWGMKDGQMTAAVQQGFGELIPALQTALLIPQVSRCISLMMDAPQGPDDPHSEACRIYGPPSIAIGCRPLGTACATPPLLISTWTIRAPRRQSICARRFICRSSKFPSPTHCFIAMSPHNSDTSPASLIQQGAARCAQAVTAGQVTAQALCEAAIAAIESRDGDINAVVVRDFERAHEQALAADARHRRGEHAPLLGVPMTVKESFNVAGLPTTWGLPLFREYRPDTDAVAVQRIKAAGAVILGKTNVPSMLADWQSANPVYGRTSHPLDAKRTPGGSSGGGAAALAAGFAALELGSDLFGSIRVPAHFCGVWGHKSSAGIAPMRGHTFPAMQEPIGPAPDMPAVIGPLGRSADDLRLALLTIAGPEAHMSVAWKLHLPAPQSMDPRHWEILLLDNHPLASMTHEVRATLEESAERLARKGARITRLAQLPPGELPDLALLHQTYISYVQTLLSAFEPGAQCAMSAHEWIRLMGRRATLRAQCFALMERFDAVLCPAFGVTAFEHANEPDWARRALNIDGLATPYHAQGAWSSLASLAGLPATQVPVHKDAQGMPMGVQLIGGWLHDLETIEIARQVAA